MNYEPAHADQSQMRLPNALFNVPDLRINSHQGYVVLAKPVFIATDQNSASFGHGWYVESLPILVIPHAVGSKAFPPYTDPPLTV